MIAYLSWHRAAPGVEPAAYEPAVERLHRSLANRPPSGFRGSATFRAAELPWLSSAENPPPADGLPSAEGPPSAVGTSYEDWYVVDDWAAIGVLEEAAVSRGHLTAHEAVAALAGPATGAVYRLLEGNVRLEQARVAVWVARPRGQGHGSVAALLGDGMDPACGGLWRRCLGFGPAPEFCVLASEPPTGVAAGRLPPGWTARSFAREPLQP